ncbi:MAG: hypothetical protein ISF22_00965 [Methanomassiliicoccus sp.]|nr:hypothetical protein [Methanomassiliicoccus sp.]
MISAVAVIALKSPLTTGAADQGNDNALGDDATTPCPDDTNDGVDDATDNVDDGTNVPDDCDEIVDPPACLTTIAACNEADGSWERALTYSWCIEKELYENEQVLRSTNSAGYDIQIEPGESAVVSYLITVERLDPCMNEVMGVVGAVQVTNTGCYDTADLAICVTIQSGSCDEFSDIASFAVDTSCHPVLAAGECYTYCYEYEFDAAKDVTYRSVATVSISNFADDAGCVQACDEFELPCDPIETVVDANAVLKDEFCIPCGFEVEALSGVGPWELCGDDSPFEVCVNLKVTNCDAPRDSIFELRNQAILIPEDSCVPLTSCVQICIYTGDVETTLDICKTAEVTWTEEMKFGLNIPNTLPVADVQTETTELAENGMPAVVEQVLISDKGVFSVCGKITVTNTGDAPTDGLFITDTVQMWNGECWVDIVCIEVDTSCKPCLGAGESYSYSYALTFCLDNVAMLPLDECLQNVAFAGICNYDDDEGMEGVSYYLPLEVPFLPEKVTMETSASYTFESCAVLPLRCEEASITFSTDLCYYQLVEVTFCGEEVRLCVNTDVTAQTSVRYVSGCDEACESLNTAVHYEGSAVVNGKEKCAEVAFESMDKDDKCMQIEIQGQCVDVNLRALLCVANDVSVAIDDNGFVISDQQCLFYGAFACTDLPDEEAPVPT